MDTQDVAQDQHGQQLSPQASEAASGLPQGAPEEVAGARVPGVKMTASEERSALDWLLGPTVALEFDVPIDYETPVGLQKLTFRIRQMDPQRIDQIDAANRRGDGPFARLDAPSFQADLVSEATVYITDGSGRRFDPRGDAWMGGAPSPSLAMALRFRFQGGLLEALVDQVRAISGYSGDRVGTATRAMVEVGKDS